MMLFKTIDYLFKGTRYGVWSIALLCIPCCIVLTICNFSYGLTAIFTCLSALLLSMAIVLILLPKVFIQAEFIETKRLYLGVGLSVLSLIIMGIVFITIGDFPQLNLIFI